MTGARSRRCGFTLIELLVVIAIVAILCQLLFPVFSRAREQGRSAFCKTNLHNIQMVMRMYMQDYDQYVPFCRWRAFSRPAPGG